MIPENFKITEKESEKELLVLGFDNGKLLCADIKSGELIDIQLTKLKEKYKFLGLN